MNLQRVGVATLVGLAGGMEEGCGAGIGRENGSCCDEEWGEGEHLGGVFFVLP